MLRAIPFLSEAAIDEILSRQRSRDKAFAKAEDIETNGNFVPVDKIVLQQVGRFRSDDFQLQVKIQPGGTSSVYEYTATIERDKEQTRVLNWQRGLPRVQQESLYATLNSNRSAGSTYLDMRQMKTTVGLGSKRIGLAFLREKGLDLQIWDGGRSPRWAMGVVHSGDGEDSAPGKIEIPKPVDWMLILPTYLCTTRHTALPSSHPRELADMLAFELPRLVPCSTQQWAWDFSVVDVREDGTSQVLVALSPLSVVKAALEQVHALGIEPRLATVSAGFHAMRLSCSKDAEKLGSRGYVWWDCDSLDVFVMTGTRLTSLRGVRTCENGAEDTPRVEMEVGRSLSMFRQEGICASELPLHVGGSHPGVPQLVERLRRMPGIQVDSVADETAASGSCTGGVAPEASPARWLKKRSQTALINLLPEESKEKSRRILRRHAIVMHGLRTCLVIVLMLLCLKMSIWRTTRLTETYQQRLAEIAPLAQKLQFLQGQLDLIRTQVQGSVSMLDIVGQLYQVLPQDVTIHYLTIDQDRQVILRAQAKRLSQVPDCIDPLERSPYLSNVRQNYAHLREIEGQVLIDFELRADLEKLRTKEAGS